MRTHYYHSPKPLCDHCGSTDVELYAGLVLDSGWYGGKFYQVANGIARVMMVLCQKHLEQYQYYETEYQAGRATYPWVKLPWQPKWGSDKEAVTSRHLEARLKKSGCQ